MLCSLCFFFSSRRRHTRCLSDWSSDVCSSDLGGRGPGVRQLGRRRFLALAAALPGAAWTGAAAATALPDLPRLDGTLKIGRHTSELQSLRHLVCRLLLEKKKKKT